MCAYVFVPPKKLNASVLREKKKNVSAGICHVCKSVSVGKSTGCGSLNQGQDSLHIFLSSTIL